MCYVIFLCVTCGFVRVCVYFFFLMIRRPPRSTLDRSSAASDVYKRQLQLHALGRVLPVLGCDVTGGAWHARGLVLGTLHDLSLIHISEPTRPY